MDRFFTLIATKVSRTVGRPFAFVAAVTIILGWGVTGPLFGYSDTWQLVINTGTTIITFLMVFVIQNSQNRDAAAMQAKLDELIRTQQEARNAFIGIEHLTDVQIECIRAALESEGEALEDARLERHESVDRFLKRL
ncbi:low affinity iron permease family protein [Blastomonas fulva]|jgi:low affinity Fe/Cu permease|uniref:low affinity iron permease family protein n=1 Tax=Blastomonas fulva TaxID=1550728 RepID=UPI003D2AB65F